MGPREHGRHGPGPADEQRGQRLDTEVGYGVRIGTRFIGTPAAGVRTSEYGRDYRIGYRIQVLEQERLNFSSASTPNAARARRSRYRSRAEAPTSASSGAQRCSGSDSGSVVIDTQVARGRAAARAAIDR